MTTRLIMFSLPILLVGYFLIQPFFKKVVYDFCVQNNWQVQGGVKAATQTLDGLEIEVDTTAFLLSHPKDEQKALRGLRWKDTPYVKVELAPTPGERTVSLVWIPEIENAFTIPVKVPAMASTILIDTQNDRPWNKRYAWDDRFPGKGQINRFGLILQTNTEIRRIALLSQLNLIDLARVAWEEYWTVEPVKVSSINFQYGLDVLGVPLSTALGSVAALLGTIVLIRTRRDTILLFFWGALACFVLFDVTVNHTLLKHAKYSSTISAWHVDRFEEYRSRFGLEFARLDRLLKRHVPNGTPVAFPDPIPWPVRGETNWVWFLYYGEYDNVRDRYGNNAHIDENTQFIFYYHPRKLIHDRNLGIIQHREHQSNPQGRNDRTGFS